MAEIKTTAEIRAEMDRLAVMFQAQAERESHERVTDMRDMTGFGCLLCELCDCADLAVRCDWGELPEDTATATQGRMQFWRNVTQVGGDNRTLNGIRQLFLHSLYAYGKGGDCDMSIVCQPNCNCCCTSPGPEGEADGR